MKQSVSKNPRLSTRKRAAALNIFRPSSQQILSTLQLKPYHLQLVQELKPPDWPRRLNFCQWLLNFFWNNIAVFNQMFFTDKAWFHLDGFINAQNYRIWSSEKPQEYRETGLHSKKLSVWCAVSRRRIVGPIFF